MKQKKNKSTKWIVIAVICALPLICLMNTPSFIWEMADYLYEGTSFGGLTLKKQVQGAIEKGVNLDSLVPEQANYYTYLHLAALSNNLEAAELLLDNGANINVKDKIGASPLHRAAQRGQVKLVKYLIDKGADIEAKNNSGSTPLNFAIDAGINTKEIMHLLIQNGAEVNSRDSNGNTQLYWAASYGYHKAVSVLLENGADVNALSKFDTTPLDDALTPREKHASSWGKRKAARIIRKYGGKKAEELKAEWE